MHNARYVRTERYQTQGICGLLWTAGLDRLTRSEKLDEYSKSGPKTTNATRRKSERDKDRLVQRLLEIESEQDFIEELRNRRITQEQPAYKVALNAWREKHRVR